MKLNYMDLKYLFRISISVILTAFVARGQAQQTYAFTARECMDYAAKNSLQVRNALLGIRIQEETNREYTAAAFPRIGGSVGANYYPNVPTQVFPNFIAAATYGVLEKEGVADQYGNLIKSPKDFGFVQAQFGTKYNASFGMEISQLLFDGQVFVGLQARASALRLAQKSAEVTEENIRANVLKIYYQLAAARKQSTTIDINLERIEKLLTDTRELYRNGFAEKLDIDKLQVSLVNLQTEKEKIDRQIESGYLGLKLLMGMPMKDNLVLTDTVPDKELKKDILEAAYDYNDRKEVQQLKIAAELGNFNVRRFQLSKIPTIALFGQYQKTALRNSFNFFDFGQTWFPTSLVGLKMNVSLFEGLARNAHIQKARYELEQTHNNMSLLKQSIDNDVEQARIKFRNALLSMDEQAKNMELAEKTFEVAKIKYGQGAGSSLELLNVQSELRVAQNNYYNALYDAIIARVDYQKSVGKL